jgi:ADP-ribose pyrophosphatase YjhB (NUDIX family)/catechol 2,3-dioxygenase-like lactoylglutathione lyase family enzyme
LVTRYAAAMPEIAAVGAIAVQNGAVLLIKRGRPPGLGLWSLPGGRVEVGESDREAVIREVLEETGLNVEVVDFVGEVERPGIGGVVYRIRDFSVRILAGSLGAGDDAADIAWVPLDSLAQWPVTDGLVEALSSWGVVPMFRLRPIHHVQLAIPAGGEDACRAFWGGVLGMTELAKPAALAARGGCWFRGGDLEVHLGVEAAFVPARKAHPGLLVSGLTEIATRLEAAGFPVTWDDDFPGHDRFYAADPFGNRLEFLQES